MDRNSGPPPTFILGYPQTDREKAQQRNAVKANASRLRLRKGAIPVVFAPSSSSRGSTSRFRLETPGRVRMAFNRQAQKQRRALRSSTREGDFVDPQPFSTWPDSILLDLSIASSLDTKSLPSPMPLPQIALFSSDELRFIVSQLFDVFNQVLPSRPSGENELATTWIHRVTSEPGILYAEALSQLTRNRVTQSPSARAQRQILQCQSETVSFINAQLADPATECSDSNIHAVMALATHFAKENGVPERPQGHGPAQGPLNSLKLLNLYGGPIQPVAFHWKALRKMIEIRGGLQSIDDQGLAGQLCYAGILRASRILEHPRIPFVPLLAIDFDRELSRLQRDGHPLANLGRGFSILDRFGSEQKSFDLRIALRRLSLYTMAVDDYAAGRAMTQRLAILGEERNFVQHGIMSLTPVLTEPCPAGDELLDLCQLAAVIYSLLCVFPFPAAPFELIVNHIKRMIIAHRFSREWSEAPDLMLWIIFITAIASLDLEEERETRRLFIKILDRCLRKRKIDSWEMLKTNVLLEFLWLPVTNDSDGNDLWDEIEASNPFEIG